MVRVCKRACDIINDLGDLASQYICNAVLSGTQQLVGSDLCQTVNSIDVGC